ncbi:Procollagen galactosyltransferase 2 [Crenichthys baileyi]|uniref:Procollagen galactosyltransferase 2 n=1 Tax=Crenichthys baileyi TaxID=28760 RepID=A0AAV9QW89_9TELE
MVCFLGTEMMVENLNHEGTSHSYRNTPVNVQYMSHFKPRDLKAFSVEPLLLYPTHYTGEPGYISDTETSTIWDDEAVATDWDRQHARKTAQQGRIRPVAQNSVTGDSPPPAARASRDEL